MSDLTIGDFWGIESVAPEMTDGNGTSLVLVRNEKGKELLDKVKSELRIIEVSYGEGVRGNPAEYESVARPVQRDTFFDDMMNLSFEKLKIKYASTIRVPLKIKIKSGIKKILLKIDWIGGGTDNNASYGLLFVLRVGKERHLKMINVKGYPIC